MHTPLIGVRYRLTLRTKDISARVNESLDLWSNFARLIVLILLYCLPYSVRSNPVCHHCGNLFVYWFDFIPAMTHSHSITLYRICFLLSPVKLLSFCIVAREIAIWFAFLIVHCVYLLTISFNKNYLILFLHVPLLNFERVLYLSFHIARL